MSSRIIIVGVGSSLYLPTISVISFTAWGCSFAILASYYGSDIIPTRKNIIRAGDIVYNKGLTLVNPVHPEKQTDVVVPVVDKDRKIKTTHMKKTDYKKYIEKNQITINKDTILNVYPLINWEHYNLEAGEYSLYLMYRDTTMASDSFFKRPLIISNKVCLIVEDCPVKWWMFWKRKNIDYHKFEKCILK